jgi:hypothetical protein
MLKWGGRNISNGISPIGAAMSAEHSANRLAFINPNALQFEISTNNGTSWTALNWSDEKKINHVTLSEKLYLGSTSTSTSEKHCARMTLNA